MAHDIVDEINSMRREMRALKTGGNIGFGQLGYSLSTFNVYLLKSSVTTFSYYCRGMLENVLPMCQVLLDPAMFVSTLSNVGIVYSQYDYRTLRVDISLGNNTTSDVQTTVTLNVLGCSAVFVNEYDAEYD